jgi:hypothetical protein
MNTNHSSDEKSPDHESPLELINLKKRTTPARLSGRSRGDRHNRGRWANP